MHIKTEDLKKGMRFSKDVFFDDGQCLLLAAGNTMSDRELRALNQWKVLFVVTDGKILQQDEDIELETLETLDDELEEVEDITNTIYIEGSQLSDENITLVSKMVVFNLPKEVKESAPYQDYKNILKKIEEVFSSIKEGKSLSSRELSKEAEMIVSIAQSHPEESVMILLSANIEDDQASLEVLNTALLVSILSFAMNLEKTVILNAVIATLFHRIGTLKFPSPAMHKKEALTDAELQILNTQISFAQKLVVNEIGYSEDIARIIEQQHERWDGKGKPKALAGEDIEIEARVIAVADEFISMLGKKEHKKPIMSYEAVKNLLADSAHAVDPNIVKVVVQCLGLYPIGSIVLLNDGSICKVVKTATDAPLRPVVEVVLSETGKISSETQKQIIDLKTEKAKVILRAVDPRVYLH